MRLMLRFVPSARNLIHSADAIVYFLRHAVHDQRQRVVALAHCCCDLADGQSDAAARMHPGETDDSRLRSDCVKQARDHLVGGGGGRIVEQRDLSHRGADARCHQGN
jgi:hypothetical protein